MKTYTIRINCACFEDIEIEAVNKEEAIKLAENKFNCPADSPEFCEVLEVTTP